MQREQVAGHEPCANHGPCGHRKARHAPCEALGPPRAATRRQREKERRNPDRQARREREVTRQQRIRIRARTDRQNQKRRKRGLGHVELAHPLQVTQRPATLGDQQGHAREIAGDQYQIRDAARHLRAGALRDREARALQRRHIVHAVPDHRHVAALSAQRLDDRLLPLG